MALGAILGAIFGGVSSAVSSQQQNAQAQAAADASNKYNRQIYDFQVQEQNRQYEYAVEGLEITKRNNEANLQFQEGERKQQYDYGMGIRDYEFQQANRVYDKSVSRAFQQQSFNDLAFKAATTDQDRLIHEQLLSISFDETQTLLDYGAAAAGLGLQKRQAKGAAATQAQMTRIQALKATGAAAARGVSGLSAAKNVQGMLAETGARQAAIIDELMYNMEANDQQLFKMNQQLIFDKAGYAMSRESAQLTDMASRAKLTQQMLQATLNAEASIALKPEIAPPLPKPMALPRPEYQAVFKPGTPPPPMANAPAQVNMFSSILGGAVSGAQMGASIQSSFGNMNRYQGGGSGGLKGISPYSALNGANYGGGAATGAFSGATGLGSTQFSGSGFSASGNTFGVGNAFKIKPF